MTEKDNILRAKDIIPGRPGAPAAGRDEAPGDIPRFNLADDIMAEHRRLTAARRKGPSPAIERAPGVEYRKSNIAFTSQWDPVIADIVARDIERLCTFGR